MPNIDPPTVHLQDIGSLSVNLLISNHIYVHFLLLSLQYCRFTTVLKMLFVLHSSGLFFKHLAFSLGLSQFDVIYVAVVTNSVL